ncbi:hypothetical protein NQ317_004383 [Molorchus minor]|uniref:Uncharacterized protein n=1 Tax=Molorchus minor TaxID=1323400 RepID=A0ABQ9J6K6_9CUCU|nr:hypothetical protein NQ317_004383 [Molorchus minor]
MGILNKLVSFAVGIPSFTVLMVASVWMQQWGNTSPNSCKLAETFINDYFCFHSGSLDRLKVLPNICPQFTANLMTAIADNYFGVTKKEFLFPPKRLLNIIIFWISNHSSLCTAAQEKAAILPPGAIAMDAVTPIAGLLKWCVLAPIYKEDSAEYSRLHLALLNSILEIPRSSPPKAIYAQHLAYCINPILTYAGDLKTKQELKLNQILSESALQMSLDRFAQAIQVAYSMCSIYGHVDDFFNQLKQLPFNKSLNIVINTYKKE